MGRFRGVIVSKNLIVDLDHSLIDIDLFQLSSKKALLKNPFLIFIMPFWLMVGKSFLKNKLVKRVKIDAKRLPYNNAVIDYIKQRKELGDKIILATASHYIYANSVANYLKLFDEVMASDKNFNLSSQNKADKLIAKFGNKNFDYIGDHMRDMPVWRAADLTIVATKCAGKKVITRTKNFKRLLV